MSETTVEPWPYIGGCMSRISDSIAPLYGSRTSYAVGDVVMYQGTRYVCKNAIATLPTTGFNPDDWTKQSVQEAISAD